MKIAQIAPIIERVPPKKYGGTERVVYALTEELVKRGHEVTLFASGDSITSAKLVSVYPRALREAKINDIYGPNMFTMLNIGLAYSKQKEFDIIHDHSGHLSLSAANISQTPVVMTLHGAFNTENKRIFEVLKNPYFVSISNSQAKSAPNLNHIGCVYNGLNMEDYPFSPDHDGYLLFVGRISMEKGVHNAIEIAQFLNLSLIIAAKLDSVDVPYFNEYVGPKLSETIRWVGEVDEKERNLLMSRAMCFLHPITWKEPFGLTMIEAMACGCPVVGFDKGSVKEVVAHEKTGFIVSDTEEMIEAITNIHKIKRTSCRRYALKNFSAQKMADGYEEVYRKILQEKVSLPLAPAIKLQA
ncbi:MAG: glycosyltransferase family 4 protein [Patescibacteria group bacterium]|nr:glycosyltransferase family 4 protein [Patescibacteria group bacterium]